MAFSPKEYLKARRPERFSDSVRREIPALDRSQLEYHLDTLTSRNQEAAFAEFARELCKREVCPNILPQTGPTGGGDSKVDAETFPVSEGLSLVWLTGAESGADKQRWGFAFSAMKKWKPKIESDIRKLAKTGRGYTKAFFVTNQYVRDKARAEVEDSLRKECELDVRIFDRMWILERVFTNHHEEMASKLLGISLTVQTSVSVGPMDLERARELTEVEDRISLAVQENRLGYQLVDDSIKSAKLARGLERPRDEVRSRHERAVRLAQAHGHIHQKVFALYDRAWTAYWWLEDVAELSACYEQLEATVHGSDNAHHLGLLTNLWTVVFAASRAEDQSELREKLTEWTRSLADNLRSVGGNDDRPANALEAQSDLLRIELLSATESDRPAVIDKAKKVLSRSQALVGFSLETFAETFVELGTYIGDWPGYDDLYESITDTVTRRSGEVAGARLLAQRGAQLLDSGSPYEAMRVVGRALGKLHKHESREDAIRALSLIAAAYDRVGLVWSARGSAACAAALAMQDFSQFGEITPTQANCLNHLKWMELQTGRLPRILEWHHIDTLLVQRLLASGHIKPKSLDVNTSHFDAMLAIFFLRADVDQLSALVALHDTLDGLGLFNSAAALLYTLGHEAEFPKEWFDGHPTADSVRRLFVSWRDQPAAADLRLPLTLGNETPCVLASTVLGCHITAECPNQSPFVELAESMLAALESLCATGLVDHISTREPSLTVLITPDFDLSSLFNVSFSEQHGRHHVSIRCTDFNAQQLSREQQQEIKGLLYDLLIGILPRILLVSDWESSMTKLFRDDLAAERAIDFTTSFVTQGRILGGAARTSIASWLEADAKIFPLLRDSAWDAVERSALKAGGILISPRPSESAPSSPPFKRPDFKDVKHTQIRTHSIMRELLWTKAGWEAVMFSDDSTGQLPPYLSPVFRNADVAREIFTLLQSDVGLVDHLNLIRIAIVREIDRTRPHYYRIVIGSNIFSPANHSTGTLHLSMHRVITMTPDSSHNLDRFLRFYSLAGSFFFAPAIFSEDGAPKLLENFAIAMSSLAVRKAWEIGSNDIDVSGIAPEDDPIIPADAHDPPVVTLLAEIRARQFSPSIFNQEADDSSSTRHSAATPKSRAEERKAQRKRQKNATKRKKPKGG